MIQCRTLPFLIALLLLASCNGDNNQRMEFTGFIDATMVRVSSETSGRLLAIFAEEGRSVNKGDTIATINIERLNYQSEQQDALLNEIEYQQKSAIERRTAAMIQRDNLYRKVERFRTLLSQNAVTEQSVDDLSAQLDAADAELRSADQSLAALGSKKAQILAGKNVIQTQQNDAHILAPLSGTVIVRYAEAGEVLGPGSPVCEIADLSVMWARIYLSAAQAARVQLGQEVQIFADGSSTAVVGSLRWISDKAEFTPKTILTEDTRASLMYAAKVSISHPDGSLKIGMPVTVVINGKQ